MESWENAIFISHYDYDMSDSSRLGGNNSFVSLRFQKSNILLINLPSDEHVILIISFHCL
jgi:hypothetical protein